MLKFPPYKPIKLTNRIIYSNKVQNYNIFYKMIDINSKKVLGEMIARPEVIHDSYQRFSPNALEYTSFYIKKLKSNVRNIGVGTQLINIAKKESYKYLCSGNVHLLAGNTQNPLDNPFIFYRKMGFSFNRYARHVQEYVDDCIKKNIPADTKRCSPIQPMYIEKCVINQAKDIEETYWFKVKYPYLYRYL